jgi:quinol monooxygenase YgiN
VALGGNLRYDVLQQGSRPNHLTLVEIWSGDKALEGHDTTPHTTKYRSDLMPMSGSPYDQRLYRALQ